MLVCWFLIWWCLVGLLELCAWGMSWCVGGLELVCLSWCVGASVVDPNTLNLDPDPDPGFWPNLDPDPYLGPDPGLPVYYQL